jgi:hypothetical protein
MRSFITCTLLQVQSRGMRWAGYAARMERNAYRILVGKPQRKETTRKM